ncbi:MAG: cell wall hydrolase [Limnochordia bacterium]
MFSRLPDPQQNMVRFAWAAAAVVLVFSFSAVGEPLGLIRQSTPPQAPVLEVPGEGEEPGDPPADGLAQDPQPVSPEGQFSALTVHTVEAGDSLYWIALTYGLSIAELKELNNLKSDVLRVGQRLLVPVDQVKHYPVGVRLTNQEVEWLAQMIYAEARGEPYLGQVAVGAVIINRMLSPQFPNTLRGVLFQTNAFQPIQNGSFYMTPNETARRAALEALNGHDPTGGALFFFNPRRSSDRFMHSRPVKVTIGNHRFTM